MVVLSRADVRIVRQDKMLADDELTAVIEQHIAMSDVDPGRLILEVSENVAAANLHDCERLAKRLRGLGCGFALDNFGSTFASFRHLRDLPLSFLKIDGDLIVTVTESRTGQLTIKSLVELARGLGAETVAEPHEEGLHDRPCERDSPRARRPRDRPAHPRDPARGPHPRARPATRAALRAC